MARAWRYLLAALAAAAIGAPAPAAADEVVVEDLVFGVRNVNRSFVPCPADGLPYELHGHLVAPKAVTGEGPDGVTLYLHGGLTGEPTWRLPGQDHALEMAKLGHASVTFSQIGFPPNKSPNGYLTCHGSEADVARQIIAQLKDDGLPRPEGFPSFERVALAGHSGGSFAAEIAAYSSLGADLESAPPDAPVPPSASPDALVLMGNGRVEDVSQEGAEFAINANLPCAFGGEGFPGRVGYVKVDISEHEHLFFYRAKRQAIEAFSEELDFQPCGPDGSVPATALLQRIGVSQIDVPVLIINGDHDGFFPAGSAEEHLKDFSGSLDRTAEDLSGTGHMLMLERSARDVFRPTLSRWLRERGF